MDEFFDGPNPEEIQKLESRIEPLEDAARKIGCYLDRAVVTTIPGPFGPRLAVVAEFSLGKVAFTGRVQDPEQEQIDRVFSEMTFGFGSDEFLDANARVERNLAAGRQAFDDGDEGDG